MLDRIRLPKGDTAKLLRNGITHLTVAMTVGSMETPIEHEVPVSTFVVDYGLLKRLVDEGQSLQPIVKKFQADLELLVESLKRSGQSKPEEAPINGNTAVSNP